MKKRILSVILCLAMVATMFAGCTPAGQGSSKKIKVAAIETAYGSEMWKAVCEAFTAETGIEVELITDKNLESVIGASMQGGDYPDVVHLATGREAGLTEQFIKDNLLTDLSDVLNMKVPGEDKKVSDKIAGGFTETALTNPYSDGKTYLAPMFYSPCGLFYNETLLKDNGWEVPTTWDEMWELGEKAKAKGIALFTYPTAGYFDAFFYALMYSVGGPEFFEKATHYEKGIWETAEGKKCLEIVAKLAEYTHKSTPAQANNQDYTKNQQFILDNKAIFMPNGTWVVGEMAEATRAEGFKWGMTALPAVEKGGAGYSFTWFEQAWIPSGAKNVDGAKQFVAFLYSDKAADLFANTKYKDAEGNEKVSGAFQPIIGIADKLEGDNKLFYSIYDNGAKAAMGGFAAYESVAGLGTVQEEFFDPVNSLVAGTLTLEQWKANIIKANDLMRENLK